MVRFFEPAVWVYRLPSLAALWLLAVLPSNGLGIEFCPSQLLFAISCPACGLTRSMSSLLHLNWLESLAYHPLGILVLVWLVGCLATNRPDFFSGAVSHILGGKFSRCLYPGLLMAAVVVWLSRLVLIPNSLM